MLLSFPLLLLTPSRCRPKVFLGTLCFGSLCGDALQLRLGLQWGALYRVLVFPMSLEHRFRRIFEVSQHRTHRHEWSQCSMPHACFLAGQLLKQGSFNSGFCGLFDFT